VRALSPGYPSAAGRPLSRAVAVLAAVAAAACAPSSGVEMAAIAKVEPSVLEQGDVLRIEGSGFVEGPTRVTLSGAFDPSGLVPPEHRVVVVDGVAISETSVEVPITGTVMASLAAEPLRFEGRVGVDFPSALIGGSTRISATSDAVALDLRPAGSGIASSARRVREADRILARLGVSLAPSPEGNELLIASVESGGIADRYGISPGDRLLAVDGVALAAPADLAGLRQDQSYRFELVTSTGRSHVAALRLAPLDPGAADEVAAILLTAIALGLLLSFAAPKVRSDAAFPGARANPLADALGLAAASVPILVLPAVSILTGARLSATAVLFTGAVGGLVVSTLYSRAGAARRIASFVARLAAILAVPALAAAVGSSLDVSEAVANQDGERWGWHAWTDPFALVAYVSAAMLIWPERARDASGGPAARFGSWIAAVFTAMAIAAYGLGGWLVPGMPAEALARDVPLLLLGIALYAAKTWLVLLAARSFSRTGAAERRKRAGSAKRPLAAAAILVGASGAALAWEWARLPAELVSAGRILSAGVFFALATAFLTRLVWERLAAARAQRSDSAKTAVLESGP
jgi:hypothetical protein